MEFSYNCTGAYKNEQNHHEMLISICDPTLLFAILYETPCRWRRPFLHFSFTPFHHFIFPPVHHSTRWRRPTAWRTRMWQGRAPGEPWQGELHCRHPNRAQPGSSSSSSFNSSNSSYTLSSVTQSPIHPVILSPCQPVTMSPSHPVTMSPCYPVHPVT